MILVRPTLHEPMNILSDSTLFSPLDRHFAMLIGRLAKKHYPEAALAAALASRTTREGNICLDLEEYAGKPLHPDSPRTGINAFICPSPHDWTVQLMQSGVVSQDEGNTPLVLDGKGRLYLRRYWEYENTVTRFILQRADSVYANLNYAKLDEDLKKLFPPFPAAGIDWQQIAAIAAVIRSFCVISGGPGTGKTSTVARILALLSGQHNNTRQLRILLGAPTGKAASRLQQSIDETGLLQTSAEHLQATTLHRMLGHVPNSPYFRHNAENPLTADIIVIDEASMVDLPLLAKLMGAVPTAARLILLGDRHQLASVQPGSVLGDICHALSMATFSTEFCRFISEYTDYSIAPAPQPWTQTAPFSLQDSFVELKQSYRFDPGSEIARLGTAVKEGDGAGALDLLLGAQDGSLTWSDVPASAEIGKKLQDCPDIAHFTALQQIQGPDSCFTHLESFRILCALRSGPFGMERVNMLLEQFIAQQMQDDSRNHPAEQSAGIKTDLPFRPVMVTRNDYNLQLYNGDVGIIMPDPKKQRSLRVFFRGEAGLLRNIAPTLLPGHETVFAMTVHKSQGSEFNRVLLILPDRDSPLLTRELLYTAITRAREKVEIWGRKEIFVAAVKRQINRTSGLPEALWGGGK